MEWVGVSSVIGLKTEGLILQPRCLALFDFKTKKQKKTCCSRSEAMWVSFYDVGFLEAPYPFTLYYFYWYLFLVTLAWCKYCNLYNPSMSEYLVFRILKMSNHYNISRENVLGQSSCETVTPRPVAHPY